MMLLLLLLLILLPTTKEKGNIVAQPASGSLLAGKALSHGDKTSPGKIELETEFNNDTDEKQTYTFQFEKVRTASVEVSYQKGFSVGGKASFSVGLPKVLGDGSIGAEFERYLQVTKSTGEKFEESLKTSATSDIVVAKRSRYIARVVMEERLLLSHFKTVVEMSMPAKKAPIYVKSKKTGETIFVRSICNLHRIFNNFKEVEKVQDRIEAVRFTVEGMIDGVQLSTHKINLHSDSSIPAHTKDQRKNAAIGGTEQVATAPKKPTEE